VEYSELPFYFCEAEKVHRADKTAGTGWAMNEKF